ncbi:hypothetical protein [Pseudomonas sp. 37 R 15]|nr:hypothetical protein [Pseudomonas sp. 37 R 15]
MFSSGCFLDYNTIGKHLQSKQDLCIDEVLCISILQTSDK